MGFIRGDSLEVLPTLPEDSVDTVTTDPPYNLGEPLFNGPCMAE
jgi:DNA modification methylase